MKISNEFKEFLEQPRENQDVDKYVEFMVEHNLYREIESYKYVEILTYDNEAWSRDIDSNSSGYIPLGEPDDKVNAKANFESYLEHLKTSDNPKSSLSYNALKLDNKTFKELLSLPNNEVVEKLEAIVHLKLQQKLKSIDEKFDALITIEDKKIQGNISKSFNETHDVFTKNGQKWHTIKPSDGFKAFLEEPSDKYNKFMTELDSRSSEIMSEHRYDLDSKSSNSNYQTTFTPSSDVNESIESSENKLKTMHEEIGIDSSLPLMEKVALAGEKIRSSISNGSSLFSSLATFSAQINEISLKVSIKKINDIEPEYAIFNEDGNYINCNVLVEEFNNGELVTSTEASTEFIFGENYGFTIIESALTRVRKIQLSRDLSEIEMDYFGNAEYALFSESYNLNEQRTKLLKDFKDVHNIEAEERYPNMDHLSDTEKEVYNELDSQHTKSYLELEAQIKRTTTINASLEDNSGIIPVRESIESIRAGLDNEKSVVDEIKEIFAKDTKNIRSSISNGSNLFSFDKPDNNKALDKILREIHEKNHPEDDGDSYPK